MLLGLLLLLRLMLRLIIAGLLWLLIWVVVPVAVLESCLLILHPCWLTIEIIEIAGALRLLLIHRVTRPVYGTLLLITLIPASCLRLGRLRRRIIYQQILIAVFKFSLSQVLFFLAQSNSFRQVIIIRSILTSLLTSFAVLFGFILARFDGQSVL